MSANLPAYSRLKIYASSMVSMAGGLLFELGLFYYLNDQYGGYNRNIKGQTIYGLIVIGLIVCAIMAGIALRAKQKNDLLLLGAMEVGFALPTIGVTSQFLKLPGNMKVLCLVPLVIGFYLMLRGFTCIKKAGKLRST